MRLLASLVTLPLLWTVAADNQSWSLDHRHSKYASEYSLVAERSFIPNSTSSATYLDSNGEPSIPNSTSSATYLDSNGEPSIRNSTFSIKHLETNGEPTIPNLTSFAIQSDVLGNDIEFNLDDNATATPHFKNHSRLAMIASPIDRKNILNSRPDSLNSSDNFRNQSFHGEMATIADFNLPKENLTSQYIFKNEDSTILQPEATFHYSHLRETMSGLRKSMVKLGIAGNCSPLSKREVERTAAQVIDHVLLNDESINNDTFSKSWKQDHPVTEMLQLVFNKLPNRVKKCEYESSDIDYYESDLTNMLASLDPELVEFLSYKIMPVKEYFGVDSANILERSLPILENICRNALKVMDHELLLCLDDLSFLVKVISTGQLERSTDTRRYKRYAAVITDALDTDSDVNRRDGYGDGGYSNDYKDTPSYVIIPESGGYDYYYPLLLKFLSALALGTYGFLGLLCFHTFVKGATNTGPPGLKGFKGVNGAKGMSGDQGMKGVKGDVGPDGDEGSVGILGEPGDIGMQGPKGIQGDPGPPGAQGAQGSPGPNGMKGQKGDPGPPGDPGPVGIKGEVGEKGIKGIERKKRSIHRKRVNGIGGELLNSHDLLQILYQMLDDDQEEEVMQDIDLIQRMNVLWKAYKSPPNCVRCKLFDFLKYQDFKSLEPYIIAGFSELLGASESLQLLNEVREGKRRGMNMRCRSRKNTCDLELL